MKINLRDYYPFYTNDFFIDVEEIIATALQSMELLEKSYRKRMNRHKAYYSLNRNDGIEGELTLLVLSPPEIYERKATNQELYAAMNSLTGKQAKRVYAHYFLGMSKSAIATAEGEDESTIRKSIKVGLLRMKNFLEKK